VVFSAEQALDFLLGSWPVEPDHEAREAIAMCGRVVSARMPPEQGLRFFKEAAAAAGILYTLRSKGSYRQMAFR
jgi:hypothetical protein